MLKDKREHEIEARKQRLERALLAAEANGDRKLAAFLLNQLAWLPVLKACA